MKHYLIVAAIAASFAITPAFAADVGVSVSIGQPGFYGQINIGNYPAPQVIYRQPRMVQRVDMNRQPVYLRVPPGHRKNWKRHCREYNACGERVYFVQDNWYQQEYVPRYQEEQRRNERGGDRQDNRGNNGNNGNNGNDHGGNDHGGNDHGGNDHGKSHHGKD